MASLSLRERMDPRRFFLGEKAAEGPVRLTHRRIFILPNKRGLGLLLLLAIQLLASINYNNNLGYILTFLVGNIALIGSIYCYRNLAGLVIRAGYPAPVFAGDAARFALFLENPTSTPRIALQVGLRRGTPQEINLAPGDSVQVILEVKASRRGWMDLPAITLAGVFPLGVFRAWSPVNIKQRVLVYPRPAPDSLPFPSSLGGNTGQRRAYADDFHGFQTYQPGDPLRRIHWKGVAKGQGVHVKEYRGDDNIDLCLDWAMTPGFDAESKLSRLCRWALDAEKTGATYGLRLPGTDLPPSSGQAHLRLCLERLALFAL